MPVAPSFQDLIDSGQAELQDRRPDLTVREGDVTEADLHAAGAMGDRVIQYGSEAFKATFFDGAVGDELDALVDDRLNFQRDPATAAQGTVEFTRTSAGAAGTIPAGTQVGTDFDPAGNQIVFTTDADVAVGAGNNGPFTAAVTAVNTGSAGNVRGGAPGTITKVIDALFDTTFTVNNPDDCAGGNEEESDEDLRKRAKTFYLTLARGTLAALEQGALLVPSVRIVHAVEDPDTFEVTVVVADADGGSTLQMVSDVVTELENWRCAGVAVTVIGGTRALVDIDLSLTDVSPGFDVEAVAGLVSDAVTARMKKLRQGQTAFLDSIRAAVISVAPDDIFDVQINAITVDGDPASSEDDIVPAQYEVLRAQTITVS